MIYNSIGIGFYTTCQWLITILIVRIAGFESAGIYSVAISFTNIFFVLSSFGVKAYQVSDINKKFDDNIYLSSRVITCVLAFLLCCVTAAFYNYIYYTVAGFTENDTLRSNQVRAGVLSREEALGMLREENAPRENSIMWYLDRINIDAEKAISIVNNIPKLYR